MESRKIEGLSNYLIHEDGSIYSLDKYVAYRLDGFRALKKGKKIIGSKTWDGYSIVKLTNDEGVKKIYKRHRLVAIAFIPNPENKRTVNHKDGNKMNNSLDNLEWATDSENVKHSYDIGLNKVIEGVDHHSSKLNMNQVSNIRNLKNKHTHEYIANMFNVSRSTITDIINNKRYKK